MRNILILIVVVIVAVFAYLYFNAGSLVAQVIETVGSEAMGTNVEVGSVDLNLAEQTAAIHQFTIANPSGFSDAYAFSLNEISVTVESVTPDLIVLSEVVVSAPHVLYEITEGGSNIDAIRANVEAYQGSLGGGGSGSETKIIIDRLRFTGGEVTAIGAGREVTVDLPPLTLTNIGRASGGETAAQIGAQIADAMTQHVVQTVARAEIERRLGIGGVLDRVRDIFGQ